MKSYLLVLVLLACSGCLLAADDTGASSDTFNGQPVGPGLSADDANAYVDSVVKAQLAKNAGTGSKLNMNIAGGAVSDLKRLGVANLIAAYSQTKGDILDVVNATRDPSDEMKRGLLKMALSQSTTPADIDALLAIYDAHPLIMEVLIDHPEWDADPRVADFIVAQLDKIPEAYKKSDLAPGYLLTLAARNASPTVQSKVDSFLTDATSNDSHYSNGHLYVDLIAVYARTGSPLIAKHLPDIFGVLGNRVKPTVSDPFTEISTQSLFVQLTAAMRFGLAWKDNKAVAATALFSDQKNRDVVLKLAKDSEDSNFNGLNPIEVYVLEAACGDKAALKKVAEAARQDGNYSFQAKDYLSTVKTEGSGNTTSHIDEAVYDPTTATWTISAGN